MQSKSIFSSSLFSLLVFAFPVCLTISRLPVSRHSVLTKKVATVEVERDKFKRSTEEETSLRKQYEQKVNQQSKKLAELQSEFRSLEEQVEGAKEEKITVEKKLEEVAEENSHLKVSLDDLQRDKRTIEVKTGELEQAVDQYKVQLKQAMKAAIMTEDESTSRQLTKKIHRLEQDLASSKTLVQKREREVEELKADYEGKIVALKKERADLERKSTSTNLSTVTSPPPKLSIQLPFSSSKLGTAQSLKSMNIFLVVFYLGGNLGG